ncbi:hypothetical protein HMPREF3186_00670 [Gemella haemolysans]|uniref:Uncharacterized protein n=1 Tax=Gemella haemolysans TaxID=1379 RepID=A0A134A0A8_9BACL|nr:hypothetical protein HMPREF3186_00670 [Gemella haemolysans]
MNLKLMSIFINAKSLEPNNKVLYYIFIILFIFLCCFSFI